ncbi:cache domain-containing protein [Alkalilimnicola ehrlichii]|uniref:PDC sensor domain-containing protein n=1 Tax=Alkalilimnicola ehrlichii TaxID=351052 RepID=UPI0015F24FC9|nr:cache domain-containing protein [Alkalilimnicola ehrlichii]
MAAALFAWADYRTRVLATESWFERFQAQAAVAAEQLDEDLVRLSAIADDLALDLSLGEVPLDQLEARLAEVVEQNPYLFGVVVAFSPEAEPLSGQLYAPYWVKRDDRHRLIQIEDFYDYTDADWFRAGIRSAGWINPFFGEASQTMVSGYCAPFQLPGSAPAVDGVHDGTVCVDYSLEDVRELVTALDLGPTGYAFVISSDGQFVSHPQRSYVRQGLTLQALATQLRDPQLRRLAERATDLRSGAIAYSNELTGQDAWIFFSPIPVPQWSLAVVAVYDEVPLNLTHHKRSQIVVTIGLVLGLCAVLVALASYRLYSQRVLWGSSVGIALVFLIGIVRIWSVEFVEVGRDPPDSVMLVDSTAMENYLADYRRQLEEHSIGEPLLVPTGVYIEAIRFETPHDFVVSGIIWQRYESPEHDDLERALFFPDAVPDKDVLRPLFRFRDGNDEVIGWFFKTTLHQPTDYTRFPIDVRNLQLRVWHPDMERGVVLVPALGDYSLLHPTALPGLEAGFALPGWQVFRSFFAYRFFDYRVSFGISEIAKDGDFPELTYNIVVRRNLTDAFISNQVPLFVAAIMLFAMLMIDTRRQEQASLYGFTTSRVLGTAAAIFFIILLAHIDIRRRYVAEQIMYIEYFYFITYFAIVAIAINAFMLAGPHYSRFFHYKDNLIPKLLYWPLLHGGFFFVTVLIFYR